MMVIQSMVHMVMQTHSLQRVKVMVVLRDLSQVMMRIKKPPIYSDQVDLFWEILYKIIFTNHLLIPTLTNIMEGSVKLQNFPKEHMHTLPLEIPPVISDIHISQSHIIMKLILSTMTIASVKRMQF